MPKVSIGLPVYNGENFLINAIDSLLNQTFEDFELIISDNASTDETQKICESFASQDKRIRYYRNKTNYGAAWNYNYVFKLSKGELFKWAAHDDLCAPTYLEKCVQIFHEKKSVVLCYSKTVVINEQGATIGKRCDNVPIVSHEHCKRFKEYLLNSEGGIEKVFGLIRSSFLERTPLIGSYNASDRVLLAYLVLLGEFYEIPEDLFFRRDHQLMSSRMYSPSSNGYTAWFDPKKKGKLVFPKNRRAFEYIKCVFSAKLSIIARTRCLIFLGHWLWRLKFPLIAEIIINIKQRKNFN